MIRTALKGVFAHKLRLALTSLSIVLGVAFVAGSFVFTDTISSGFDELLDDAFVGVDVSIRQAGTGFDTEYGRIPDDLVEVIANLDVTEHVVGEVWGFAQIISEDGDPIGGMGPPTLGAAWYELDGVGAIRINPGNGRGPTAPEEVVIDAGTARVHGFEVGDQVDVLTLAGVATYELVGIISFGDADNMMGATMVGWEFETAQRVLGLEGLVTEITTKAKQGVSPEELREAVSAVLPSGYEAITGDQYTAETTQGIDQAMSFVFLALLAFAAVAIFVGGFIIQNTFRIVVAQRTRELALLRAVGAKRSQVTGLVVTEAAIVAVFSSALGVLAGIGLAKVLYSFMIAGGIGMPSLSLAVRPRTVVVAMAVGLISTVISATLPAIKASRVPPVAAMGEHEYRVPQASLRRRSLVGLAVVAASITVLLTGLLASTDQALALVGAGSLGIFVGVSIISPLLAAPVGRVVGAPFRGITGRLARENTGRQPRRTAATASALMIGVALVSFVAVFGASIKASMTEALDRAFPTDLAFQGSGMLPEVSPHAVDAIRSLDEVKLVSPVAQGTLEVNGVSTGMVAVDPVTIGEVYFMDASTSETKLAGGVFLNQTFAKASGIQVGDTVELTFWRGEVVPTPVTGTYTDATFAQVLIPLETYWDHHDNPYYAIAFADLKDGVTSEQGVAAATAALAAFPNISINTKADQISQLEEQVESSVALLTGLLALAVLIGVLGVANTLALSVVERTREIGLLRAIGMSRRSVRAMIRYEAIIVAVFGAVLGIVIGIGLAATVVASLETEGFTELAIPTTSLAGWVVFSMVAGIAAAFFPARKAARMEVLDAISYQ